MLVYALNFLLGISVFSFKNTLEISNNEWGGFLVILALFKHPCEWYLPQSANTYYWSSCRFPRSIYR